MQAELVCADCIAAHIARVANRTRERMGYASVLDDADRVLQLAKRAGACDNFVSVEIGDRRNEQHTYAAAGEGLCTALAGPQKAPAVTRSRWAPADEFRRLHPNVSQSSWRGRVVAEANRSVNFFKARRTPAATEELLREMLGPTRRNWRDYAVLVLWGEVFLARKYFSHVKVAGHGVLLRTAWQRKKFGNVAFLVFAALDIKAIVRRGGATSLPEVERRATQDRVGFVMSSLL